MRKVGPAAAFAAGGYCLMVLMAGMNIATPLYGIYEQRFDLTPVWVTVTFAAYCLALLPALLWLGPTADRHGPAPVIRYGLAAAAASTIVLAAAGSVTWVLIARIAQGLAVGACSGPLSAVMVNHSPFRLPRRASTAAALTACFGVGVGPILGGVLAQFGPWPLRLPYLVELVLLLIGLVATRAIPGKPPDAGPGQGPRAAPAATALTVFGPAVFGPANRSEFLVAACTSSLAWTTAALFLTLVPAYVAAGQPHADVGMKGIAAGGLLVVAAAAQLAGPAVRHRRDETVGLSLAGLGCAVLVWVVLSQAADRYVAVAVVVAGIGMGLAFRGAMRHVNAIAVDTCRSAAVSALYSTTYLVEAVFVGATGLLAHRTGTIHAVTLSLSTLAVACVASLLLIRRASSPPITAGSV